MVVDVLLVVAAVTLVGTVRLFADIMGLASGDFKDIVLAVVGLVMLTLQLRNIRKADEIKEATNCGTQDVKESVVTATETVKKAVTANTEEVKAAVAEVKVANSVDNEAAKSANTVDNKATHDSLVDKIERVLQLQLREWEKGRGDDSVDLSKIKKVVQEAVTAAIAGRDGKV